MSILVTPETRVLIQGITGSFGSRHAQLSLDYGTQIVAGVTPGKGGQIFQQVVPIFDTVSQAAKETGLWKTARFVRIRNSGFAGLITYGNIRWAPVWRTKWGWEKQYR